MVYAKPPFAGPEAVLAYLSRYTHRVAISNSRLVRFDEAGVTFRYKDYRRSGADRQQVMTLAADEFIRRFLLHGLPKGFHRIRHYGLLASGTRKDHLERARQLLAVAPPAANDPPGRTAGSQTAMLILRWTHGHHRDLRPAISAPRTAGRGGLTRETGAVNRHSSTPTDSVATVLPGAGTSAFDPPESSRPMAKVRRSASGQPSRRPRSRPSALDNVRISAAIYPDEDRPKLKSP